jgi:uncharacterized membrane protein YfcA
MQLRTLRRATRSCYRLGRRRPQPRPSGPQRKSILSPFDDISSAELLLIAATGSVTSLLGGVTGYGTGALMPLVLVPILGPEPVVPIIAISGTLTNVSRALAFRAAIDWRRVLIVACAATPTSILGAFAYTLLSGPGAMLLIGSMLVAVVVLRRLIGHHRLRCSDRGLAVGALGWGLVVGGTTGAGVIVISLLVAAGLTGASVIATDAALSIVIGVARLAVFGFAGVLTAKVVAVAVLIGVVTFPGAFLARLVLERLPLHIHTAMLEAVVVIGGAVMIAGAIAKMD